MIARYLFLIGSYLWCGRCDFFFSSRRRHTRFDCDWSSDVCSSDLSRCLRKDDEIDRRLELAELRQHAADALHVGGVLALGGADLGDGEAGHGCGGKVDWERGVEGKRGDLRGCRNI